MRPSGSCLSWGLGEEQGGWRGEREQRKRGRDGGGWRGGGKEGGRREGRRRKGERAHEQRQAWVLDVPTQEGDGPLSSAPSSLPSAPASLSKPEIQWGRVCPCGLYIQFPFSLLLNKARRVTPSRNYWFFHRKCWKPEESSMIPRAHLELRAIRRGRRNPRAATWRGVWGQPARKVGQALSAKTLFSTKYLSTGGLISLDATRCIGIQKTRGSRQPWAT